MQTLNFKRPGQQEQLKKQRQQHEELLRLSLKVARLEMKNGKLFLGENH